MYRMSRRQYDVILASFKRSSRDSNAEIVVLEYINSVYRLHKRITKILITD